MQQVPVTARSHPSDGRVLDMMQCSSVTLVLLVVSKTYGPWWLNMNGNDGWKPLCVICHYQLSVYLTWCIHKFVHFQNLLLMHLLQPHNTSSRLV